MNSSKNQKRSILIGDVHGCWDELQALLKLVETNHDDELICIGDLIGKGPHSLAVLRWAMSKPQLQCVMGNSEDRYLKFWREGKVAHDNSKEVELYKPLDSEEYVQFIQSWPHYLNKKDFLAVHAGVNPHVSSLNEQNPNDLMNIRFLPGSEIPWYEEYRENKLIVYGHWAKPKPIVRANTIGLDTGCVYGGALTALILPQKRLVSVPALREYRKKLSWPKI